jgi:hypothetical protein
MGARKLKPPTWARRLTAEMSPEKILPLIERGGYAHGIIAGLAIHGIKVSVGSDRVKTFLKGLACVTCGIQGTHFVVEESNSGSLHLNLYARTPDGGEVMMTSDHIVPKSRGGADHLSNRQPMCTNCNHKKGSMIGIEHFGKDHWSTFAYIETCCVDNHGVVDNERMRTHKDLHPGLVGFRCAQFDTKSPTRLRGYWLPDGSKDESRLAKNHDDWSCVEDAVDAGLLEWNGTGLHPVFSLTEKGLKVAALLRAHKAKGGNFADFTVDPTAI